MDYTTFTALFLNDMVFYLFKGAPKPLLGVLPTHTLHFVCEQIRYLISYGIVCDPMMFVKLLHPTQRAYALRRLCLAQFNIEPKHVNGLPIAYMYVEPHVASAVEWTILLARGNRVVADLHGGPVQPFTVSALSAEALAKIKQFFTYWRPKLVIHCQNLHKYGPLEYLPWRERPALSSLQSDSHFSSVVSWAMKRRFTRSYAPCRGRVHMRVDDATTYHPCEAEAIIDLESGACSYAHAYQLFLLHASPMETHACFFLAPEMRYPFQYDTEG
jgi:hypothetical protein